MTTAPDLCDKSRNRSNFKTSCGSGTSPNPDNDSPTLAMLDQSPHSSGISLDLFHQNWSRMKIQCKPNANSFSLFFQSTLNLQFCCHLKHQEVEKLWTSSAPTTPAARLAERTRSRVTSSLWGECFFDTGFLSCFIVCRFELVLSSVV